ncbi:hypothetical protein D3C86_1221500 [compost metagenome]
MQDEGGENDGEKRRGITDGDEFRQRQHGQPIKTAGHREDAQKTALEMAEEIVGVQRARQRMQPGEINDDRDDGEGGTEEGDLAGRHVTCGLDAGLHDKKKADRNQLHANPAKGIHRFGVHWQLLISAAQTRHREIFMRERTTQGKWMSQG